MKVKDLISTFGGEELGIEVFDENTDKRLVHMWKTDWSCSYKKDSENAMSHIHEYDDMNISYWDTDYRKLIIYVAI